ncbi:dihydropteroate synthase [Rhodopirellula europaea]|uniref:Dihydropteroate synthase n=1 Tax=Rhodopirellula europaea 6C TaxID=1263867 RepID=M2B5Y6_9BACT|nr:dihydropteroate synthase [Rhodopirellula europaea]EMB17614.1 dihydropteroate synthase [Rhodopirellula europaea 6C]
MMQRAVWRTSRRDLEIGRRPLVMGILNVTPDSFSDGGRFVSPGQQLTTSETLDLAVETALKMQADGADLIDIGGESTRPYSDPVDAEIETERVGPVIERLANCLAIPISIDTSKASVANAAIRAGAEIVNDVSGLEGDPEMPAVVVKTRVGVCVMHMKGTPQTMQDDPSYRDVVDEIERYLLARRQACLDQGIEPERICLDPGIGFGKTHDHNLTLLRATNRFASIGSPILIGHSRKGFIRKVLDRNERNLNDEYNPMAGTLAVSMAVAAAGAHVIRVHDVAETVQALDLFEASGGLAVSTNNRAF